MRLQWTFGVLLALPGFAAMALATTPYSVSQKAVEGHTTYHLMDSGRHMDVGIVPDMGNFVCQFKSNGKDVLIPPVSFKEYLAKHWFCCGIPFLEPWANRIDKNYYYFQGQKYLLNDDLGNLLRLPDTKLIIHGLLVFDPRWKVVKTGASAAAGAFITSRLDFYKYPDLMAQFPFAHSIEITYRLKDGKLENTTEIQNVSAAAMPVFFGYHPYFRPDGPREDWTVSIGAKLHWIPDDHTQLLPTGETEPADKYLPHAEEFKLDKTFIDDGFSDLVRDAQGLGHYWVKGKTEKIEMVFGKEYNFGHVYAPLDNTLICLEPETATTNAFNLNHGGKFPDLIVLQPGKTFRASYWIVPTGF
ncbi:MAG TPA: aldose 1-epimerase [Terriglobia bacterium]|nr:aldose 1-epimerase [Terriglobia bacterium]